MNDREYGRIVWAEARERTASLISSRQYCSELLTAEIIKMGTIYAARARIPATILAGDETHGSSPQKRRIQP
jgi:hypothetical protein